VPKMFLHAPQGAFTAEARARVAAELTELGMACERLIDTPQIRAGIWVYFVEHARHSVPRRAWMREKQPPLLVIWGKHDLSFDLGEPERYRNDVPDAQIHVLDASHFALDTKADEIAALVRGFMETRKR
jgi:pimeloyl-ACP methyl ester carboxylesterase